MDAPYKYLLVLASHEVNPLIVLPVDLFNILLKVKHEMRRNPQLELLDDPDINNWVYFSIKEVIPVVMDDLF